MYNKDIAIVDNNRILYNGIKMEMFVPDDFFKSGYAEEVGTSFYIFGNVRCLHYTNKTDDRNKASVSVLQYPLKFYTKPDEVSQEKIDFGDGDKKYWVLTYYKGAVLMSTAEVIKDANNVSYLINMLMAGKLDMVEYSMIPTMLSLCKHYNGVDLEVPATYEEVMVAEYYRAKSDPTKPARFEAAITKNPHYYARGITEREKVSFTSTFSGLTFEDMTSMLTMASNAAEEGREETISETEKVSLGLI